MGKLLDLSLKGLLNGKSPDGMVEDLLENTNKKTSKGVYQVLDGLRYNDPVKYVQKNIGNGGKVDSTFFSSLYCFLRTPDDFRKSVLTAVNCGGDTDSRASLTGAMAGAYQGLGRIPSEWVTQVEDSNNLLKKAKALYSLRKQRNKHKLTTINIMITMA